MSWLRKNSIVFIMLLFGVIAGSVSYMYMGDLLKPHQQVEAPKEKIPEVAEEPQVQNEIKRGKWLEIPRERNIVVLIDNDKLARPQAGLQEADMVYEVPIEGGTTRFMAIYSRRSAELIGPIRSARDYLVDLAQEHDPIFVHAGGSPLAFAKFGEIGNLNGLEGGVDRAFWRITEKEAPHNLYSDSETLRRVARQEGFREEIQFKEFQYLADTEGFSGDTSKKLSIEYGNSDFRAEYLYDAESMKYLRFTGGVKHFSTTSEQIKVKNIIIQMVNTKVKDSEKRLQVDLTGRNTAYFFCEGNYVKGYWIKEAGSSTKYFQADGQEIKLAPGNTWINIVPLNVKLVY